VTRPVSGPGAWTAQNTEETPMTNRPDLSTIAEAALLLDSLPSGLPLPHGLRLWPPTDQLPATVVVTLTGVAQVCEWAQAIDGTVQYVDPSCTRGAEYFTSAALGRNGGVLVRASCTAPAVAA